MSEVPLYDSRARFLCPMDCNAGMGTTGVPRSYNPTPP